jgi:uncharacterized protein with HEPN domain
VRTDEERLLDILEAISRVEAHTQGGRDDFDTNELVQVWVVHHLQIMGEAASRLSEGCRQASDIPWSKIIGMRNILVHTYFSIDKDIVWAVVESSLSQLRDSVQHLLDQQAPNEP